MKKGIKYLLLLIFLNVSANTYGQEAKTFDQKRIEIFGEIYPILNKAQKVYTKSGKFNQIHTWGISPNNESYYWFSSFEGVAESGKETAKFIGYQKTWVDFSKIKYVRSGNTNFGYNCIILTGEPESIKYQTSNFDDYGNRNGMGDFEFVNEITLPIDNDDLAEHFNALAKLCNQERENNPGKFAGLNPPKIVYQKTAQDYANAKKRTINDIIWYTCVVGGSLALVYALGL